MRFANRLLRFRVGPVDLYPKQVIVLDQATDSATQCTGKDTFYRVSYEQQGIRSETILAETTTPTASPLLGVIVGGLIALISGVMGAGLTHRFTLVRERLKERREKYNQIAPIFNTFFLAWNRSILPEELQARFDELQHQVLLSQNLIKQYQLTYQALVNKHLNADLKANKANELEQYMRRFLEKLNPD